jgi:hypothetical protein
MGIVQRRNLTSRPRRIWGFFQTRPRLPLLPARLELGLGLVQRRRAVVGGHGSWLAERRAPRTSAETRGRCGFHRCARSTRHSRRRSRRCPCRTPWPRPVGRSLRGIRILIVLAHVLAAFVDLLGLLLIHPGDFVSGITKRMQNFIQLRVNGLCIAMLRTLND